MPSYIVYFLILFNFNYQFNGLFLLIYKNPKKLHFYLVWFSFLYPMFLNYIPLSKSQKICNYSTIKSTESYKINIINFIWHLTNVKLILLSEVFSLKLDFTYVLNIMAFKLNTDSVSFSILKIYNQDISNKCP